jgi:tetratricopeptide (TPR) repeat protein
MQRLRAGLFFGLSSLLSASAWAQTPVAPAAPAPAAAAPTAAAAVPSTSVKRDPRGIQGISPFWEAILKGDNAYIARDFDTATSAYKQAIEAKPEDGLGHYRLGAAELAKGNLDAAAKAWQQAIRFSSGDPKLRAKTEFVLADLEERKKAYDEATARWKQYGDFVKTKADARGYAATATERVKRIDEWKKLSADSAEVKTRIEKRIKEADESMRKSSK